MRGFVAKILKTSQMIVETRGQKKDCYGTRTKLSVRKRRFALIYILLIDRKGLPLNQV